MRPLFHKLTSWWFATMAPPYGPLATISQRETLRKRRLLSLVIGLTFLLIMFSAIGTSLTAYTPQLLLVWIDCGLLLLALWLNRRGYLQRAGLLAFFTEGCSVLLSVYSSSFSEPISVLWLLSPIALILVMAGLFLSAWMIVIIAAFETIVVLWYLLVERFTVLTSLLAPQERWNFLIYLVLVIFTCAMIGVVYTVTTKNALLQADRATELEQAHQDVTRAYHELEVAHTMIQQQALTDALTGLPNHRAVMDQLTKELNRTRRHGLSFSLLFFDADRFKRINDTHSHATGDAVLRQIGERVSRILRSENTLGRFGGEEFVLLLPDTTAGEASLIAERIRTSVAFEPMATSEVEGGIVMTVSIGVSTYLTAEDTEQDLLSQADAAMYMAKRLGRNQVRTAEEAKRMGTDVELMALLQSEEQSEATLREEVTPESLRETYTVRVICSLLSLLERRDQQMSAHAHGVSDLATTIAQMMGLLPKEVSRIGMAALLHDIGKIAVPDALLLKRDSLSSQECAILRDHAELGAQILEASPFLYDLVPAVLHHHEHWDGSGYPNQLKGEAIPLAARIIAVAEAYDFMQREHPYRVSCSPEEAMAELRHGAGLQFDPAVVQALQEGISQLKSHSLQTIR